MSSSEYSIETYTDSAKISQIPTMLLDEIRDLFYSYFDHPWLINIIDELPENPGSFGTIRSFLALRSIDPDENSLILNGILSLKKMVRIINIWLIPESTVILGISPLSAEREFSNMKIRKCIAYTLPVNTRNLASLVEDLEKEIIRTSLLKS